MYVDMFDIVVDLSVDSFRVFTFSAIQSEIPAPTGGRFRADMYKSKVAIPCDSKHRVMSLRDEVTYLQRRMRLHSGHL